MSRESAAVELEYGARARVVPIGATLRFIRRLVREPRGLIAMILLGTLAIFAFVVPLIDPVSPFDFLNVAALAPPSGSHWFGTDELGRDLFIRNAVGLRTTVIAGVGAVCGGWLVGIGLGYFAGYSGGIVDSTISRITDTMLAIPGIVVAILLIALLGTGVWTISLSILIFNIPISVRLARGAVLRELVRDYVLAAEAIGCSGRRVLYRHIVRNTFGVFAVQLPIAIVYSVLIMAALNYLGLGSKPPQPSLGDLMNQGQRYMQTDAWYLVTPVAVLVLLTLALNFLSDVLAEMLDPIRRGRA